MQGSTVTLVHQPRWAECSKPLRYVYDGSRESFKVYVPYVLIDVKVHEMLARLPDVPASVTYMANILTLRCPEQTLGHCT